jgi:hypothetical protein
MKMYALDPLADHRWVDFLAKHPRSSIFHTRGWLETLSRTYGYVPIVFTTSPPDTELANGLVFCDVKTWIGGRRLVSLPFSDHCAPLVDCSKDLACLISGLQNGLKPGRWRYVELRPPDPPSTGTGSFQKTETFCFHKLDLRPTLDQLFRNFHKDCVQRKILRAERESVSYQAGKSKSLLNEFYGLLLMTRRRHGLPPQPLSWFRQLIECLGDSVTIHIAHWRGTAISGMLTLRHKDTLVYKYGVSDHARSNLGGTQLLFWRAIQEAKRDQLAELDLGRSDSDNPGLIAFKDRLGATRSALNYWRYSEHTIEKLGARWGAGMAKSMFRHMPDTMLSTAGKLFYKYAG